MSKKKKKRGILASRFYRVYFAVVAVALLAVAIGLVWLNGVVKDYEISQPVHAAEEVAKLFEDGDYDRIYDLDASASEISGGDRAFYVQSLTELAAGREVRWREAYSADPNEKKYSVSLDGDKLATFTLVPSGRTTGHGNTLWQLGSVDTNVALKGSEEAEAAEAADAAADGLTVACRVKAPSGYTVTVDGRALTEADATGAVESIYPEGFLPSSVTPPTLVEYAFYAGQEAPVIAATDGTGAAAEVLPDGENAWTCPLREDAEARDQYTEAVVKLAERIAKYTVKDLSRSNVLANVISDSPAEEILRKFSNSWAPPHKTAVVTDAVVSDFRLMSEDCFTCHVEFTFTLTTRRGNDYVYPTAYTFCVVRHKGEGRLYNLLFN